MAPLALAARMRESAQPRPWSAAHAASWPARASISMAPRSWCQFSPRASGISSPRSRAIGRGGLAPRSEYLPCRDRSGRAADGGELSAGAATPSPRDTSPRLLRGPEGVDRGQQLRQGPDGLRHRGDVSHRGNSPLMPHIDGLSSRARGPRIHLLAQAPCSQPEVGSDPGRRAPDARTLDPGVESEVPSSGRSIAAAPFAYILAASGLWWIAELVLRLGVRATARRSRRRFWSRSPRSTRAGTPCGT